MTQAWHLTWSMGRFRMSLSAVVIFNNIGSLTRSNSRKRIQRHGRSISRGSADGHGAVKSSAIEGHAMEHRVVDFQKIGPSLVTSSNPSLKERQKPRLRLLPYCIENTSPKLSPGLHASRASAPSRKKSLMARTKVSNRKSGVSSEPEIRCQLTRIRRKSSVEIRRKSSVDLNLY